MKNLKLPQIVISLRKDNINDQGLCPLNYYIKFNGKTIKRGVGESIKEKEWNPKKKEVIGKSVRLQTIQKKMSSKVDEFETEIQNLVYNKKPITEKVIKDFFEGQKPNDFFAYYDDFVKGLEKNKKAKSTIGKYKNTIKVFKEFLPGSKVLTFGDVTDKVILDFNKYLEGKDLFINTIYNYHKNLRTVLRDALCYEVINSHPYLRFKPKKIAPLNPRIPLNKKEVAKIEQLKFKPEDHDLYLIKDYFLFYCNTGCRFSEIFSIKRTGFNRESFKHIDCKSKKEISKPLNEKAWKLLVKYAARNKNGLVFKRVSNPTVNKKLKRLATLAGIDKNLITHLGRHTIATQLRENGIALEDICSILGQKKLDTTLIYSKPNGRNLFNAVNGL